MLGKKKTALLEIFSPVDDVDTSELLGQFLCRIMFGRQVEG